MAVLASVEITAWVMMFGIMARPPEEIRRRLDELIERCTKFRAHHVGESEPQEPEPQEPEPQEPEPQGPRRFQMPTFEQWRFLVSSLQTVGNACGKESPHYRELEACRAFYLAPNGALDLDRCRGILQAARDDLEAGMLMDLRQLVTAETFGDVLESASYLLEEGHHLPAIALAGAVLESSLRALAKARTVMWAGSSGISKINAELYKANVYDKVIHGEIEAWGKLRNKVNHGDFSTPSDIDTEIAKRMLEGVRHFVASHR